MPNPGDSVVLEKTARRALVAWQNLGSDPSGIDWSTGAKKADKGAARAGRIPSADGPERQHRSSVWKDTISQTFGNGKSAERARAGLEVALADEANPDVRDLGGGVDSLTFTTESIGTDTATLTADATVWAAYASRQNNVWSYARPTNREVVVFQFARNGGKWALTDLTSSLADGTAP